MNLYNIYDAAAGKYFGRFYHLQNDSHAIRAFQQALTEDKQMNQAPDDFTLFRVGTYDDDKGFPEGHLPERVITGLDALKSLAKQQAKLASLHQQIEKITETGQYPSDTPEIQ